jgi:hypothetical protein
MIISSTARKDTYVTNLNLGLNNASKSNVGKASTLDMFKIAGESTKIKSRCKLQILQLPSNGDTFRIQDYLKNSIDDSVVFEFVENSINDNPGELVGNNIKIGLGLTGSEFTISQLCDQIKSVIEAASTDNTNGFSIGVIKLDTTTLVLEQKIAGSVGDKENSSSNSTSISITNFIRIQHSCTLIDFDLEKIKEYCFDENNFANSSFSNSSNYKVYLKLFDVGNASTRPIDFNLRLSILSEEFEEGIGSDIYNFSDKGVANFVNINKDQTWENENFLSEQDCLTNFYHNILHTNNTEKGNEDFVFDITNYFTQYITNSHNSTSFAISFNKDFLFDDYTYFVKRFGSTQINNRLKKPRIEVHLDESTFDSILTNDKKRYIENEETFYIFNKTNRLTEFNTDFTYKLKLEYILSDNTNALNIDLDSNVETEDFVLSGSDVYNFRGVKQTGIKKFVVPNNLITRSNQNLISDILTDNKVQIKMTYFYVDQSDNEVTLKTNNVDFYSPEILDNISLKKSLLPVISFENDNVYANNEINKVFVEFIDYQKEYAAVNVPTKLESENIGDVYYEMYDIDTGEKIVTHNDSLNNDSNKAVFNGKKYLINLFACDILQNKRVNFKFHYKDFNDTQLYTIFDSKYSVRFL